MELADWSVENMLYYKWTYSWKDLLKFYKRKQTIFAERKKCDYEFVISVASAALGGKKSEEEVGLLNEDDIEEMSPEQEEAMRKMLGADFSKVFKSQSEE